MDIFNKKLVRQLKEENENLLGMLEARLEYPQTLRVYENNIEQLKSRVVIERDVPIEIVKQRLVREIVDKIIELNLVEFDVEHDPRTMKDCVSARLFVGKRG